MTTTTRMGINTRMGMKRCTLTVIPAWWWDQAGIQSSHPTAPMAQHTTTEWIPA
jgi:hypothetical protein